MKSERQKNKKENDKKKKEIEKNCLSSPFWWWNWSIETGIKTNARIEMSLLLLFILKVLKKFLFSYFSYIFLLLVQNTHSTNISSYWEKSSGTNFVDGKKKYKAKDEEKKGQNCSLGFFFCCCFLLIFLLFIFFTK